MRNWTILCGKGGISVDQRRPGYTFNLTFITGKLPNDLKSERITPTFKGKGNNSDPNNYRSISFVPTITKIPGTAVKEQLMSYSITNDINDIFHII